MRQKIRRTPPLRAGLSSTCSAGSAGLPTVAILHWRRSRHARAPLRLIARESASARHRRRISLQHRVPSWSVAAPEVMPSAHQGARRPRIGGRRGAVVTVAAPQQQGLVSVRRESEEGGIFRGELERRTSTRAARRRPIVRRDRGAAARADASYGLMFDPCRRGTRDVQDAPPAPPAPRGPPSPDHHPGVQVSDGARARGALPPTAMAPVPGMRAPSTMARMMRPVPGLVCTCASSCGEQPARRRVVVHVAGARPRQGPRIIPQPIRRCAALLEAAPAYCKTGCRSPRCPWA